MFFESFLLNLAILAALIIALIFDYATKFFSYWYIRHVPYKTSIPFFGSDYHRVLFLKSTSQEVKHLYSRYPDSLVGTIKSRIPDLLVKQPDVIQRILSTDFASFHSRGLALDKSQDVCLKNNPFYAEGEKWTLLREILDSFLNEITNEFEVYLPESKTSKGVVNVQLLLTEILDAVFVECLFTGKEGGALLSDLRKSFQRRTLLEKFKSYLKEIFPSVFISLGLVTTPGQPTATPLNILNESLLSKHIRKLGFEEKLNANCRKGDIKTSEGGLIYSMFCTFIGEGYIPCMNAIVSLLFELARNPGIQQKLRHNSEIDASYLEICLKEALRMYPPYSVIQRKCVKAYQITDNGILLDKKVTVTVPIEAIHRDPMIYERPDVFDPQRFLDEKNMKHSFNYLPFGAGPRKCNGERLALRIITKVTEAIITKYKIESIDRTPNELKFADHDFKRVITNDVWLKLTPLDL